MFSIFQVDGYPVYSMATPKIDGAREMLSYLQAKPSERGLSQKVILTDLREEAVVYINGTPFVLRELDQPVDTLKHVGITGSVVSFIPICLLLQTILCPSEFFKFFNYNAGGAHGSTAQRRYSC